MDELIAVLSTTTLPFYGVRGHPGPYRVTKCGSHWIEFAHGEESDRVDVGALAIEPSGAPGQRANGKTTRCFDPYRTLSECLFFGLHAAPGEATTDEVRAWVRGLNDSLPKPDAWLPILINVDGTRREFRFLEESGHWIAFCPLSGAWLYAHSYGRRPEDVPLARLAHIEAYVRGTP
jgi:hypothetical protein